MSTPLFPYADDVRAVVVVVCLLAAAWFFHGCGVRVPSAQVCAGVQSRLTRPDPNDWAPPSGTASVCVDLVARGVQ